MADLPLVGTTFSAARKPIQKGTGGYKSLFPRKILKEGGFDIIGQHAEDQRFEVNPPVFESKKGQINMFNTTINNTHNHDNKVESGATLNQFIITDEAAAQAFLAALVKDKKPEIPQENGVAPLNSELA